MGHGNHRAQPPGPVCASMATSPSLLPPATSHTSPEGRADDTGWDTAGDRDVVAHGHQDTVFMGVSTEGWAPHSALNCWPWTSPTQACSCSWATGTP